MTAAAFSRASIGVALACVVVGAACGRTSTPAPPLRPADVLLVTIDTMRADRLGRGFTPTLDRIAAQGLSFTNARAAVPLTLPSHATILSGLLPPHHGVRLNGVGHFAGHPTLATILHSHGYSTAAAVGAFVLNAQFGLNAGFDVYDDNVRRDPNASTILEAERPATAVTDGALAALSAALPAGATARPGAGPWFLWVHYYDPHAPYTPPAEFRAKARGGAYDGEIAYVDAEIARLLEGLESRRGGAMLLVIAGDHGESLGEHGEATHGMLLYDGALRVPLIVATLEPRGGGTPPRRGDLSMCGAHLEVCERTDNVSLADVAPTILARLGMTPPSAMDGRDLAQPAAVDREVYAETQYPRVAGWSPLTALLSAPWKMIVGSRTQLFDVAADTAESRDVGAARPGIAAGMQARLREMAAGATETTASLANDARERLRSLGYVAPSAPAAVPASSPDPADRIADWRAFETALSADRGANVVKRLKDLAARNPSAQVFHSAWARALADSGRHTEALRAYRDVVTRWPGDAVLLHDLAVAARDAGQGDEALRAEQAALLVDPDYAAAVNGLGLLYADAGRSLDAVASFERATSLDRSDPSYWTNLGNARRALGREDARQAYDKALAIDAAWPDAANGIGVLEVQAGRPAAAIPWFEKALARAPELVEARLNLGIACQEAGQTARAKAYYQAVLQAPLSFARERDAARKLLQGLGR